MDLTLVPSIAIGVTITVIGYLLNRSIVAVDKSVTGISGKVDALYAKDSLLDVQLAELRVRLSHVEAEILSLQRSNK